MTSVAVGDSILGRAAGENRLPESALATTSFHAWHNEARCALDSAQSSRLVIRHNFRFSASSRINSGSLARATRLRCESR
jgi:hypothetical protein